jgi:rhodanese-related sulfurtransferase
MKFSKILLGIIIGLAIAFLFFKLQGVTGEIVNVDSDTFSEIITNEDVFVLNTHTPYVGEIDGTDLIVEDWENIDSFKDKLPSDKNEKILIYCRSGRMSGIVAEQILELGYKEIYNLEGGMKAWEASGKEILQLGQNE